MYETDMYGLCRVCLKDSHCYSHIFEELLREDFLYEVLNDVCQLDVIMDDGLPEFVCWECYRRLLEFETFKRQSHEGSAALRCMKGELVNVQVKLEAVSDEDESFAENCRGEDEMEYPLEVYLAPVKIEICETNPVCRDPLEVPDIPVRSPERSRINSEAEGRGREYLKVGSTMAKGKEYFEQRMLDLNIPANKMAVLGNEAPNDDDNRQSVGCANDYCINIFNDKEYEMQSRSVCKVRLRNETFNHQYPGGNYSNFKEHGNNCINGNYGNQFPSVNMDASKRVKHFVNSVSNRTVAKRFFCDTCAKGFRSKFDLGQHVRVHNGVRPYKCSICSKAFTQKFHLLRHKIVHRNDKPHVCYHCGGSFKEEYSLREHLKVHSVKEDYCCKICGKTFTSNSSLYRHVKCHSDHNPFPCVTCGVSFECESTFRQHLLSHSAVLPFQCQLCMKGFSCDKLRKKHELTHDVQRPYNCDVCCKSFKNRVTLKGHMNTHNSLKPYQCMTCTKTFTTKGVLQRHILSHSSLRRFPCPNCCKTFKSVNNVKQHLKFHCKGEMALKKTVCRFVDT